MYFISRHFCLSIRNGRNNKQNNNNNFCDDHIREMNEQRIKKATLNVHCHWREKIKYEQNDSILNTVSNATTTNHRAMIHRLIG